MFINSYNNAPFNGDSNVNIISSNSDSNDS